MSRQIRAQLDELKQNDTLRRELVSNISHDLRTPLTTMQGYLDTLSIKGDGLSESERVVRQCRDLAVSPSIVSPFTGGAEQYDRLFSRQAPLGGQIEKGLKRDTIDLRTLVRGQRLGLNGAIRALEGCCHMA
jgi:signal transduction histidine kinase